MARKTQGVQRRDASLSRDEIIAASIALLDAGGERGLTFRALAEHLATGAGAIYWHIDDKDDLLTASCDAIIAAAIPASPGDAAPDATIRSVALAIFDAIDARPWVGSALTHAAGQLPMVRILERIGQPLQALGVPDERHWTTVSALLNYVLGVAGQNAANTRLAREQRLDRSNFLQDVSTAWARLDPDAFPFTRAVARQLPGHDDRDDFLAGIDFMLRGIRAVSGD